MNGSPIQEKMIDNGDGTYEYTFIVSKFGNVTVSILHVIPEEVYVEFYTSGSISGTPAETEGDV